MGDIILKEKKVLVLIVTYNRCNYLEKCLDSLRAQTANIEKIVVVDNASTDKTEEFMNQQVGKYDQVHYVKLASNSGGSGGFHQGLKYINNYDYDYVWIMDDDVAPDSRCLENLLKYSNDYDVLQPIRMYEDNEFVISEPKSLNLKNPFLPLKREIVTAISENEKVIEIAAVPFEGPLISKRAIQIAGYPEYDYFIIADDTEYSIRLLKSNLKMAMIPMAILRRQIKPVKETRALSWKFYHHLKNHFDIDRKHGGVWVRNFRPMLLAMYYIGSNIYRRRGLKSYQMIYEAWKNK